MTRGFYTILTAQFLSSLADNALLIAAIQLLRTAQDPDWMSPTLKISFAFFYVVLAPFVGAFADALPKGRVMMLTNTLKLIGCLMMLIGVHPLLAYGVVGIGAAAYSPAKYGILTELLPAEKLVMANGWIEGLTVASIIFGVVLGGVLIGRPCDTFLQSLGLPWLSAPRHEAVHAILAITLIYGAAALVNAAIPDTGARYPGQERHPLRLVRVFGKACAVLWRDRLGQISLSVTTLFWGAGATLQFLVLDWAERVLGLPLSEGSILQAVVAVGVALGAVLAAVLVPLKRSVLVMPLGMVMGLVVAFTAFYQPSMVPAGGFTIGTRLITWFLLGACAQLFLIGVLSGLFVVPMNALLQHRGHTLMSAGRSIAVQNFNENISVLTMLGVYAVLLYAKLELQTIMLLFSGFVVATMVMVIARHRHNQRLVVTQLMRKPGLSDPGLKTLE